MATVGPGLAAGLERVWHHARCHRLFSTARWSIDEVGLALAGLIVERLLPDGAPLVVAVDDTLFKRSGRKVHGAAWQHDGAVKGSHPAGFGNCWVVAGLIVTVPFLSRPVCQAYLFLGRRTDLTSNHDRLLMPDELYVADGALVYRVENQGAASWGVLLEDLGDDDLGTVMRGACPRAIPRPPECGGDGE
ncbi:hypothetical protein ABIA33_005627 [Streptacidiphilus sp. MAP12-16]|uniref:transposase n=1 Tax=Streptacidiphilus sp. MAP12-16 TaxID=3156300 RepID=UPI00351839EB